MINYILLFVFVLLASCGSAPVAAPKFITEAKKAEQAGHRAIRDNDLVQARHMFNQAMLMYQAQENISASTTSGINLSSVYHLLGDDNEALRILDVIIANKTTLIEANLLAAAALRKAIILTDNGDIENANLALGLAQEFCGKPCKWENSINTLNARLLLSKGDFSGALASVQGSLSNDSNLEEQANAHRIAGSAELSLEHYDLALTHYQKALSLDKSLALSSRLAVDLRGVSASLMKLGKIKEAEIYATRAADVENAISKLNLNVKKKIQ